MQHFRGAELLRGAAFGLDHMVVGLDLRSRLLQLVGCECVEDELVAIDGKVVPEDVDVDAYNNELEKRLNILGRDSYIFSNKSFILTL